MRRVVTEGTGARYLAGVAPAIAGKTGTAEVKDKASHSWFIGYAPYETGRPADRLRRHRRARRLRRPARRPGRGRDRAGRRPARYPLRRRPAERLESRAGARSTMNDMLGKMRDLLKPWMKGTSPLEIRRAILDDVESHVVAVGERQADLPVQPAAGPPAGPRARGARPLRGRRPRGVGPPAGDRRAPRRPRLPAAAGRRRRGRLRRGGPPPLRRPPLLRRVPQPRGSRRRGDSPVAATATPVAAGPATRRAPPWS